jgi:hypothetical protein
LKNIALLLVLVFALGGCAVRISYMFLDVALLWSLDDYIEFEGQQRTGAKVAIAEFHEWHRYNELPEYALLFESLADDLERPVTPATMAQYSDQALAAWQDIMRGMAAPSATILAQLNQQQIQVLVDTMAKEEQEDLDDYKNETPQEVQQDRYKFMHNAVSKLAGKLNDEQRTRIRVWAVKLRDTGQMSIEQRSNWRERFVQILQARDDVDKLEQELTLLFVQPYLFWSEGYQQSMSYNRELTVQLLAELANSLTDSQRSHATHRLRSFAADFRALSSSETMGSKRA